MEQDYNITKLIIAFKKLIRLLSVLILVLLSGSVLAQTVSIQGVLRDPNGRSVDDGFHSVTFKIYDVESGGTELWTDTYANLETKHGVFQANLGENNSLDGLAFDTEYYVGVTVENYSEMEPRIKLTIYPYAKAILGQDNKFPSTGNIVLEEDSIIIKKGGLKFEGADGRIVFNDGTTLNTADFAGPASGLLNSSSININADKDATGNGAINFQIGGTTHGSILNDGTSSFNGALHLGASGLQVGTNAGNYARLEVNSLQAFQSNGSANALNLNPNGGSVQIGADDNSHGILNLMGAGTGSMQGARVNFNKAADHDGDGSETASEYWFMEAVNDDFRIGNIWVNNDVMTFDGTTSSVGIGRNPVNARLEVQTDGSAMNSLFMEHVGSNFIVRPVTAGSNTTIIENTGGGGLAIQPGSGNVGIGDTDPTEARLVVGGGPNNTWTLSYYLDGNGHAGPWASNPWTRDMSIYAHRGMASGDGFFVVSDARIKEIQSRSDVEDDLEALTKLKVTDYSYVDKVQHGDRIEKKLIAQEVREVYPQAVSLRKDFVPTIFAKGKGDYATDQQSLTISVEKNHDLQIGDQVKLITADGAITAEVVTIKNSKSFVIHSEKDLGEIFVYGKEVDDFHIVDYDAISMLNVAATQELAKRSKEQEQRIAALEAENVELKNKLEKVELLEAKLSAFLGQNVKKSSVVVQK